MKLKTLCAVLAVLLTADLALAAASAAINTPSRTDGANFRVRQKASTTIYAGTMVMMDGDGFARAAASLASNVGVMGIATETSTAGASAAKYVTLQSGYFKLAASSLSQTDVGTLMYAVDDMTIDETDTGNLPVVGVLVEYISATSGWVYINPDQIVRAWQSSDPITMTGDLTLQGGAGAATFTDSASSIVVNDNDASALDIGSAGATSLIRINSTNGAEGVTVNGTLACTGVSTFSDAVTLSDGATIDQAANNNIVLTENSENIIFTFAANSVALSSTTSAVFSIPVDILTITTADLNAGACTAGAIRIDTAGGTRELCICNSGGSAYDCVSFTTANGPSD